jgi:hypothetical protein
MLTFTKQDSIIIAATLGVALSVPLSITAWFPSTNAALLNKAAAPARNGNLAGPLAKPEHGSSADANLPPRGPVVDFGLYYGPHIHFRQKAEGGAIEC